MVDRWNVQDQCFFIGGHQLEIEPTDIYFFTGFPKRGVDLTLFGARAGGQSVDSLRLEYCNRQSRDKGIDIKTISLPELKVIAFTVTRLSGLPLYTLPPDPRCVWQSIAFRAPFSTGAMLCWPM